MCPMHGFGHMYEVSAWNSHKKYDFWNTQILRECFEERVKRLWNTHPSTLYLSLYYLKT